MTSPIPLRERLAAVLIKPFTAEDSREAGKCGSDQVLAGRVLVVFRDWLREQAADLRAEPFEIPGGLLGRATEIMVEQTAKYLEDVLAFAIDKELNR